MKINPTNTTQIIWTVLPNGMSAGSLQMSVFVSPRLVVAGGGSGLLKDFALGNWPATVASMDFRLFLNTAASNDPAQNNVLPAKLRAGADPATWDALFDPTQTRVDSYVPPVVPQVWTYPVKPVSDWTKNAYKQAALESPVAFPAMKGQALPAMLADLNGAKSAAPSAEIAMMQAANGSASPLQATYQRATGNANGAGLALMKAALFFNHGDHRASAAKLTGRPMSASGIPNNHPLPPDFHAILGQLGDYPMLLRRLGLVLDFDVPLPPGFAPNPNAVISVWMYWEPSRRFAWKSSTPFTGASFANNDFRPYARGEIDGGLLALDLMLRKHPNDPLTPAYNVEQLDVDGAAMKLLDFASTASGATSSLPSLRNGGFTVIRDERQDLLAQRLVRMATQASDPDHAGFYADDLTRGYCVDVKKDNGAWQSLCRREGKITLTGSNGALEIAFPSGDEGYVKGSSGASPPEYPERIYVHESIFGWNGWSLVTRRPGRAIAETPTGPEAVRFENDSTKGIVPLSFKMVTDIRTPRSTLPRLRFGHSYSFRVRVVDLAGNRLSPASTFEGGHATKAATYRRYEPIASPTILLQSEVTEGESVEHLVIRSNPVAGADARTYAAWLSAQAKPIYAATNVRHVAPPKTAQATAEAHGAFDPILTSGRSDAAAVVYGMCLKEEGTFNDLEVRDTRTGLPAKTGRRIVTTAGVVGTPRFVDYDKIEPRGEALQPGQYIVIESAHPPLPYLPDPAQSGVALVDNRTTHLAPKPIYTRGYAGTWPELAPFRFVLGEAPAGSAPIVNTKDADDTCSIKLAPGRRVTMRVSSTPMEAMLDAFAYWAEFTTPSSATRQEVLAGQHWMLTPYREITFVHAVAQPFAPDLGTFSVTRAVGQTFATCSGDLVVDGPSTGQLDLVASWSEMVDASGQPPAAVTHEMHALTFPIQYDVLKLTLVPLPDAGGDSGSGTGKKTSSLPLPPPDDPTHGYVSKPATHEFGDTKCRFIDYRLIATTRYREYFPPVVMNDVQKITTPSAPSAVGRVIVKSSARPEPPKVEYVVPTFRWENAGGARKRKGGGLRVYLARPWYSSGDGEMLAVLLAQPSSNVPAERVTQWGGDPIWYVGQAANALAPKHFLNAEPIGDAGQKVLQNVALAEGEGPVQLVAFTPKFSRERNMWFVDLEIDPEFEYAPFLRLALARLQYWSCDDALRLSNVVRAEFAQLMNDRTASYVPGKGGSLEVTVEGVAGANIMVEPSLTFPPKVTNEKRVSARTAAGPALKLPKYPGFLPFNDAASGRFVTATIQVNDNVALSDADAIDDLGWRSMADVFLDPYVQDGSVDGDTESYSPYVYWKGAVPFAPPKGTKVRLLVRERERFACDDTPSAPPGQTPPAWADIKDGSGTVQNRLPSRPYIERVVYADVFPLTNPNT